MLPAEIQAAIAGNPALQSGYQRMKDWVAAGAKHGSYAGLMPNEAVVRSEMTPWGENIHYDAAGNQVSFYRPPRVGEVSPYAGDGGPSAPEPSAQQAAASTSEFLRSIAPKILEGVSAGAPTPVASVEQPMQTYMRSINPDDLLEFIKRMGKSLPAPEPFIRSGFVAD